MTNRLVEPGKLRARCVAAYRAAVGSAIESRERVVMGCRQDCGLIGEKLAADIT